MVPVICKKKKLAGLILQEKHSGEQTLLQLNRKSWVQIIPAQSSRYCVTTRHLRASRNFILLCVSAVTLSFWEQPCSVWLTHFVRDITKLSLKGSKNFSCCYKRGREKKGQAFSKYVLVLLFFHTTLKNTGWKLLINQSQAFIAGFWAYYLLTLNM